MIDDSEYEIDLVGASLSINRTMHTIIEWATTGRPGHGVLPSRRGTDGLSFRIEDLIVFAAPDIPPEQRRQAADLAAAWARVAGSEEKIPINQRTPAWLK